ncbi:MAG: N-6 DNA methylase [Verrucomicrobia bacterium]|nr:N-6 DNA methylase [Verrucomicrobiota bacterium]
MLDTDTKRRIDTARDILVGKVPDPKSQVEQITIALIYKFMDDMDAESEEMGGKRKFFAGDFARYGWAKVMRSGLGGHETLSVYAEAIAKMPENPGIPPLFRDIFKNAYLPYHDPETLKMFLKVIGEFSYDHSERLGDAFEYLLSVLGSQGDAGQFRTPRHIIDFIVEVLDPKKTETVLDPACGTAGFLISSYKHILKANTDAKDAITLTPDEKGRLAQNFKGYDISPDMVRLSLVNMYLHGFADPHIHEYDTLTSQDRWNEYADVILANPPFMSPKGGIKPHNRFSVQSKRSEVLFVDYMAEHLTPGGRAGIIVPEGIIFQSQNAYKQLRKMLVEEYLVAVVSLPAGVFNPYSGVKTSVLILDKALAKKADTIAFFKVENDGFGLGAQRREIDKNDLPQVRADVAEYLRRLRARESAEGFEPALGLVVPKEKIAQNGDYNLSGERYRENSAALTAFPFRTIRDIAVEIRAGFASGQSSVDTVGVPHVRPMNISQDGKFVPEGMKCISEKEFKGHEDCALDIGDVLFNNTNSVELVGKTCLIESPLRGGFSNHMTRIRVNRDLCVPRFLALLLHSAWRKGQFIERATRWVGQAGINAKSLSEFQIPLPPLEVQKEIVAEIEGYQKVIDGARAVVDNYRPHIPIQPDWPMVELGRVVSFSSGGTPSKANESYWVGNTPWVSAKDMKSDVLWDASSHVSEAAVKESATQIAPVGSLLILVRGMGLANGVPICELAQPCAFNQDVKAMKPSAKINSTFLRLLLKQEEPQFRKILETAAHGTLKINTDDLAQIEVPLPPLAAQRAIVAEIEAEQAMVNANRDLIARFEKKIQATLARVWGENESAPTEA